MNPRWLLLLAFILSIGVGVGLAFAPTGESVVTAGESVTVGGEPNEEVVTTHETTSGLESEGPSILVVLAVPVVLTGVALGLGTRRASLVVGGLGFVCCFVGMMSIGLFYVPVFALVLVAARLQRRSAARTVATSAALG